MCCFLPVGSILTDSSIYLFILTYCTVPQDGDVSSPILTSFEIVKVPDPQMSMVSYCQITPGWLLLRSVSRTFLLKTGSVKYLGYLKVIYKSTSAIRMQLRWDFYKKYSQVGTRSGQCCEGKPLYSGYWESGGGWSRGEHWGAGLGTPQRHRVFASILLQWGECRNEASRADFLVPHLCWLQTFLLQLPHLFWPS